MFGRLLLLGLLWAVPLTARAATQGVGADLVVYSAPAVTSLFERLVDPFAEHTRKKFGVPVKVILVTTPVPTAWATLNAEWPHPAGDVYIVYGGHIREGIKRGYLQRLQPHYSDAEWARFDPEALRAMDTDGYAAPLLMTAVILAVQRSLPGDTVTGWSDLSKSEVAGRFTFESAVSVAAGYYVVAAAALTQGADWRRWFTPGGFDEAAARPTLELMRRWTENALTLTRGSGSIRPRLARREALAASWWWANTMQEMKGGMDIRVVYPKEGTVAAVQAGPVVTSVTRNPVAAIEWVKFVHSEFGAQIAKELNYFGRIPFVDEEPTPEWDAYLDANRVAIDDFLATVFDPAYHKPFLDAYNRIVMQGK